MLLTRNSGRTTTSEPDVTLNAEFDTRRVLGTLARWILIAQLRRTSRHLGDDLRHVAEHGTPSPRKLKQLERRHRTTSPYFGRAVAAKILSGPSPAGTPVASLHDEGGAADRQAVTGVAA